MIGGRAAVVLALASAACASGGSHTRSDDAGRAGDARPSLDSGPRDAGGRDARMAMDGGAGDARASMDGGAEGGTIADAAADAPAPVDARPDAPACPVGMLRCGTTCVNPVSDSRHCGGCDTPCGAGELCSGSMCVPPAATWSTTMRLYDCSPPGVIGMRLRYTCPPAGSAFSLWGTGVYTSDSSICTAAVHAGRITLAAGGAITVEMRAGRSSYAGSMRNGITSSSYGSYGCSFAIVEPECPAPTTACADVCGSAGDMDCGGTCTDTRTSSANCGMCGLTCVAPEVCVASACACPAGRTACGTACVDTSTDVSHCGGCMRPCAAGEICTAGTCGAVPATWSTSATDHNCADPGVIGSRFGYRCPPGGPAGSAWGTDLYTHDSSICTAAAHVGRITVAAGGDVVIEMAPGAGTYPGSTRNGITTSSWGSWGCSFTVP